MAEAGQDGVEYREGGVEVGHGVRAKRYALVRDVREALRATPARRVVRVPQHQL